MTMTVGGRTVLGRIKRREEARAVYEAARSAGKVAGLLDQERPNIFTQSVANILPGEQVKISISYVETLKYEDGVYEFVFPMVVGPRYIPGAPVGNQGGGREPDTDRVPDASRITPHVAPKGTRAGHDISIEVALDAGVPIDALKTTLHEVDVERPSDHRAIVRLKNKNELPNRDFILRYDAAGRQIEDAVLAHRSERGGFFTMLLQPPERVTADKNHIRIACFMTDGYVGNDLEIIGEVQKHSNARVFSFGIGGSVNRFLLDKIAEHGRGEVEYVSLGDDGSAAARRFHERIRNPLLTDISIDWSGLPVADLYPKRIPDLFSAKPVVVSGRYTGSGRGTIKLRGKMSGRDFVRDIPIDLPENEPRHDVLATLWARTRVDDLMSQDYNGIQRGAARPEVSEAITQLGIEYRLMTQFTSFVAVEEMTVTDGGKPRRIEVPVDMPPGVSHEGVFGSVDMTLAVRERSRQSLNQGVSTGYAAVVPPAATPRASVNGGRATPDKRKSASGKGVGAGVAGGVGYGGGSGSGSSGGAGMPAASPEELKRQQLLSKLHPSIVSLIERLKDKNAKPSADESRFVRDGKAEIQVWLSVKNPQAIAALKRLGFEVVLDPPTSKMVIGRIPVEKLAALAETNLIHYIAPDRHLTRAWAPSPLAVFLRRQAHASLPFFSSVADNRSLIAGSTRCSVDRRIGTDSTGETT